MLSDDNNINDDQNILPLQDEDEHRGKALIHGAEDWLDEQDRPDFNYLNSLVSQDSPDALEKLRSIADHYDIEYNDHTPANELVDKITLALQNAGTESI
jgi:hypothetical protein